MTRDVRLVEPETPFPVTEANATASANTISVVNSRAASTLAAAAVFQGVGEDVSAYGRIGVAITSDNATDGVLTMEVSHDNVTWGGPTRNFANTSIAEPHMWEIVEKYFRIKYTNGTTEATNLSIQTQYSGNGGVLLAHQLDATLIAETEGIITRSVLVGKTDGGDKYINVPVGADGHLEIQIPRTAFGDLRTAELSPILQVTFDATVTNTEIGIIDLAGSGAVTQENSMVKATSGATTGSAAEWETIKHAKYRAGFGGLMRFTAMFTAGVAGTEQIVGLADEDGSTSSHLNGYAVGFNGDTFSFLRWSNDVLIPVAQSAWDDPMDGTGASGMTLDPTKLNVYYINFQYLGAGTVDLYIESDQSGELVRAHRLKYANLYTVPSVRNPNFHLMVHVLNNATTSDITCWSASMAYFIEGKSKYTELQQPQFSAGKREKTAVTTETAIFTIRNKSTYNSLTNYIDIVLQNIQCSIEAGANNNLGQVRLVKNATLGGTPSYTDIDATDSIVDIDVAGTTVTGGQEFMFLPLAGKNDKDIIDLLPYEFILIPGDTLTVAGLSAASATIDAGLLWKELF
mgnify:CR=1 FL=1